jgi:hypothetical protein
VFVRGFFSPFGWEPYLEFLKGINDVFLLANHGRTEIPGGSTGVSRPEFQTGISTVGSEKSNGVGA